MPFIVIKPNHLSKTIINTDHIVCIFPYSDGKHFKMELSNRNSYFLDPEEATKIFDLIGASISITPVVDLDKIDL